MFHVGQKVIYIIKNMTGPSLVPNAPLVYLETYIVRDYDTRRVGYHSDATVRLEERLGQMYDDWEIGYKASCFKPAPSISTFTSML